MGLIIPDFNTIDSFTITQVSAIVAAVGPIIDTSNGQHVRQVIIVDPQLLQKIKLQCYNEGCMDDFIPHLDVSMSEATFQKKTIIVGNNTTVCQLTGHEIPVEIVQECDAILHPPVTSISNCSVGSIDITL